MSRACPLLTMRASAGRWSPGWNAAPGVSATQCTGQGPPWSAKCREPSGCQSRDAKTGIPASAQRDSRLLIGADHAIPVRDRQRSAGAEIVLDVHDEQRART